MAGGDPIALATQSFVSEPFVDFATEALTRCPLGIFLRLADDLGHSLELRSNDACGAGLADELRYDGDVVAAYEFIGADLARAIDGEGHVMRDYVYDALGSGHLIAIRNTSGAALAEVSHDPQWRAIGVVDAESSVSVDYDVASPSILVTEFFANGSSTGGVRTLDRTGRIASISDGCSCGPPQTFTWTASALVCSTDAQGHSTYDERDALGRVVRHARYAGSQCPPGSLGFDAEQEWRSYGLERWVAQGVRLDLDHPASVLRRSRLWASQTVGTTYDRDPAPSAIDPAGYVCQTSPLPANSVVCRETESGYVTTSSGSIVPERHATFFSYDSRGRLAKRVGPVNLDRPAPGEVTPVEERTYWPDGESPARRGRLHEIRRFGSPTSAPLVTSYDYDAFGVYRVVQPDGASTTFVKDGRGRTTFVIGPDGQRTETRYYDGLAPRIQILPSGAAIHSAYDARGRLASVERLSGDPEAPGATPVLGWSEHYQYDEAGNRKHAERRDAAGEVTWKQDRVHDVQHRAVLETNPDLPQHSRAWTYDAAGFLTKVLDEEGRATIFTPDGLSRTRKVRREGLDAQGAPVGLDVATYTYQPNAATLSSLVDGKGSSTTYRYDDFGRLEQLASSTLRGGGFAFYYDARGNVLERKDVYGYASVKYTYDGLDRVLGVNATYPAGGSSIAYTYRYDEGGRAGSLTSVVEPERVVSFAYDAARRPSVERIDESGVAQPLTTELRYDADGDLQEVWYPSGLKVRYLRDAATKEVREVRNIADGTGFATGVTHVPGGQPSGLTFGNGSTLTQTFDLRHEPLSIASGPVALTYATSPAGDVSSILEGTTTRSFSFDFLDRLTVSPGWLSYGHDGNGNRTSETVQDASLTYGYAYDRVKDSSAPSGGTSVKKRSFSYDYQSNVSGIGAYDAAGTTVTAALCLLHDALGRLVLVGTARYPQHVLPDGSFTCQTEAHVLQVLARFKYDARGRRVARWTASTGAWTYLVHDRAGSVLSEIGRTSDPASPWSRQRDYAWLDGRPLAQIEYPGASPGGEGWPYYFHLDHIGLPRALTNAAGQTVWSASTGPYGDLTETTTADPISGRTVVTNLRLPGQYDERLFAAAGLSGLQGPYYNGARWYLPRRGKVPRAGSARAHRTIQRTVQAGLVQLRQRESHSLHRSDGPARRAVLRKSEHGAVRVGRVGRSLLPACCV